MIYILQFAQPLGNSKHRAQFYIGYCKKEQLGERIEQHMNGQGAAITRACVERGIPFYVVAFFPGNRKLERRLKKQHNTRRIVDNFWKNRRLKLREKSLT